MDAQNDGPPTDPTELESRAPEEKDLVAICRELNARGALYVVIGGFAIIQAGYARTTGDIDLLIDAGLENESRVYRALEILSDKAVRELKPGEVKQYGVVRVADEVTVDLMSLAVGISYEEAANEIVVQELGGVAIPFASPRLLWRTKKPIHRDKDMGDLAFLREHFEKMGETPPEC